MVDGNLNSSAAAITAAGNDTLSTELGVAQMLRGGVAVEVRNARDAITARFAGASCLVISGPRTNGISRMADPSDIERIVKHDSIPVIARVRAGHTVEAQIVESIGAKYIDEGEIAGEDNRIDPQNFRASFVSGCRDLGEALRRISEGSAMVRIQGDPNDIVETMSRVRKLMAEIRALSDMDEDEIRAFSERIKAPYDVVLKTKQMGRLPVLQFAAGGIMDPADAALMMQLGCDGVFVDQKIWEFRDCAERIIAIVHGVKNFNDPREVARATGETSRIDVVDDALRAKKFRMRLIRFR